MALLHTQASGGNAITAPTTVLLTTPQVQGPLVLFQTRYFVRLPVDADTDQLSLSPQTSLQLSFQPEPVTIGMGASSWHHSTPQQVGADVVFDLVRPVKVASLISTYYQHAELFRMDGSHKVDDPSVSIGMNANLSDDFTAARFTAGLTLPKSNPSASNVLSLRVQGYPTSPRVKLSMDDLDKATDEVLWQWLDHPGEQAQACSVTITAETWQPALQRALSMRRAPGATEIVLYLDVISDAPCRLVITPGANGGGVQAQTQGASSTLPGAAGALRFSGEQAQCQTIALDKPIGAVSKVQLRLSITQTESTQLPNLPDARSLGQQGVRLAGGDWVARPWPQESTVFQAGFALPWWPLESSSALTLSLHADHAGHPADTAVAQTSVSTSTTHAHWLVFRWPEVPLQPGPYWVRLGVTEGGGLWLGALLESSMTLSRQSGASIHQHLSTPLGPLLQVLSTGAPPGPGATCTLQGSPMVLSPDPDVDDTKGAQVHWLATLNAVPAPLPGASSWPLVICSDDGVLVSLQDVLIDRA